MMSSKHLCVCHVVLVFQEVDGFIMVQVAVGLLFFQLMSLGKSWMAITIYSAMSFNFASIVYRFYKNTDYSVDGQCFYSFFVLFMSVYGWLEG